MIKAQFQLEKETKNTYRFQEIPDDTGKTKVGTIYIQKDALSQFNADDIFTLTFAKE